MIKKIFLIFICIFVFEGMSVFANDAVSITSISAINSSTGKPAARMAVGEFTIQAQITNDTHEEKELSLILTEMSNGVCKKVVFGGAFAVKGAAEAAITADCEILSGIDTLKCIVVSPSDGMFFPVSSTVKQFTRRGWS